MIFKAFLALLLLNSNMIMYITMTANVARVQQILYLMVKRSIIVPTSVSLRLCQL